MQNYSRPPAVALIALALSVPTFLAAQVPKPGPAGGGTRLPAPRPVIARQLPDGKIEVTWGAVPDAASYQITRSVPPEPARVLPVPASSDTVFVDQDVKPGSTYYYLVAAVNANGGAGLKAGSAPVTAAAATAEEKPSAPKAEALTAPTVFTADAFPPQYVTFWWTYPIGDVSFLIERAVVTGAQKAALDWKAVLQTDKLPCCAMTAGIREDKLSTSDNVIYRVMAVDPASPGRKSAPKESRMITPGFTRSYTLNTGAVMLEPVGGVEKRLHVGETGMMGITATGPWRIVALDRSIVSELDGRYGYVAKAPGVTWVFGIAAQPDGSPQLSVDRVTVLP